MSYIQFDKTKLINLEYSLSRELIRSNRSGAYASTTILNCNTRKYHGLLVVPQPEIDDEYHVLLSGLDETVIQHNTAFHLGLRKYPGGNWNPKGHKYIRDFESDPIPMVIYRVGGVVLKRESLLATHDDIILIRYTLLDAHSPTRLQFSPFLAFRNRHFLSAANVWADTSYTPADQGISMRLYNGYSRLFMQLSKEPAYIHVPEWYYHIEYIREQERGYDYSEDLMVPGFFELPLSKGESVIFSAGISELDADRLPVMFNEEVNSRTPRNSFTNCMINSAQQFIVERENKTEVIAGFQWYGRYARDTFIALPGLTLEIGDLKHFRSVMNTMVAEMRGPLFPNTGHGDSAVYNSADAPLWFFWSVQEYVRVTKDWKGAWTSWGEAMKTIIDGYMNGTDFHIRMNDHKLITAGGPGLALTWMDAIIDGNPVTPRSGMTVEINALWYNALAFYCQISEMAGVDVSTHQDIKEILPVVAENFVKFFWNKSRRCLYDYVLDSYRDDAVRPNQIFAASLPFSPLKEDQVKLVLDVVRSELLTPRGLRTLSPYHPDYKGDYWGNQSERDRAVHQGTVWPWLLGHFAEAWLKIYQKAGIYEIQKIYQGFEEVMREDGIGTISEVYEGNPPHRSGGAVSQAWSVAELNRIGGLLTRYMK
jgi:predicted glycogen debranching enzyme